MNAQTHDEGYNGLTKNEPSLPAECYLTETAFQRDLDTIWYRQWVYACRTEEVSETGSYQVQKIGDQEIIVLRDEHGKLQAFHNTCRHRGSVLLTETCGQLRGKSITCPYHAWSYSLQGDLKRTPSKFLQKDFDPTSKSLFSVAVQEWRGFVFINLDSDHAPAIETVMDGKGLAHKNWPAEDLRVGHRFSKQINCNWKIFWENFSECLHCPGVHPELSRLVPLYKRSLMETRDDPNWKTNSVSQDPRYKAGLAPDVESWTTDGKAVDTPFSALTEADIERGHTYETLWPTMFLVGHVDHMRIVWLLPLGPETTQVHAEWLFRPETLATDDFNAAEVAAFATTVLEQDGMASEMNQRGLRSIRFQEGSLMAEEYEVYDFQQWVRTQWQRGAT
ncbi:Rieske (2Fe-2S) domain protein [marine gamma proteobacterium HTCC2148]|nr:Rieske (2Fe-2S) domain protein [marine gamma proteobacterium HTCC2148]